MPIKLANNASGTLATAISASDTGIVLTTGDGAEFPTLGAGDYFYATITSTQGTQEIVKATARSGDTLTVVRAQEGTTAAGFAAGARFELRVTAQSVFDAVGDVVASQVGFTPTGGIAATDVQAALAEVDTEKVAFTRLDDNDGSSLVGFLQAGNLAVPTTVQTKLRETVSVFDFMTAAQIADVQAGTASIDVTAAIQDAINYAASINGGVYVPRGSYKITSTLSYAFTVAGSTFTIESERSHNQGARLMWYGAAGGTIMQLRGLNGGEITGLAFLGRGIALRSLDLLENNSTGGSGSYSININNCLFGGTTGANSAGVRVGDNTFQVSEVHFDHCIFAASYYGIDFATGVSAGNAKNWSVSRCYFYSCTYGISRGDSGFLLVSATYFGSMAEACVYGLSKQGGTTLISCGTENSKRLFDTQQNSNTNPVNIIGCYYAGSAADDIVVRAGMLFLSGNYFENSAGSGIPIISFPNGGLTSDAGTNKHYSIISQNNFYKNVSTEYAPFYSPDGDYVWNGISGNISGRAITVKSFGDIGGTGGALTQLRAMDGRSPIMMELSPLMNQFAAAGYSYVGPKPNRAVTKVTISNSVWIEAAVNARKRVFQVPPKNKLVGIICDTTQAYAGLAGTITLRVGSPAGGTYSQDMIVDHDVKTAAVTKGLADADLGTLINRANAVQGGTMSWTGNTEVYVSLISGTGNIGDGSVTNLSAGSTTIYIVTEVLEFQ